MFPMKKLLRAFKIGVGTFLWKFGTTHLRGKGLQKVWPFGFLYRTIDVMLKRHEWPEEFLIDGHRLSMPPQFRASFAVFKGKREAPTRQLFRDEIPRGSTVIDVGANIGMHTVTFARCVGPEGEVFAFEPGPDNLTLLRRNIEVNGYKNVKIVPKAVGERSGTVELHMSDANPGDHRSYDPKKKLTESRVLTEDDKKLELEPHAPRRVVEVEMVSLDDYFSGYDRPIGLVKMDVQGAEGGVFAGMGKLMDRNRSMKLAFEFWPAGMRLYGTDPEALLNELRSRGFIFFDTSDAMVGGKAVLKEVSIEDLLRSHGTDVFAKR